MEPDTRTKEYLEKLGDMKLSETSRARIKGELVSYAHFHGERVEGVGRSIGQVPTGTSLFRRIYNTTLKPMNALVIIALILSGGTSFAAAGSVPGDFLYPVKVGVNENVKSALAVTSAAEASLQAELTKERLEEAETLALRGELTVDAATDLRARIKNHYEASMAQSAEAESNGDLETAATVRASLAGTLTTYASILTRLTADVAGNDGTDLLIDLNSYVEATAKTQATATAEVSADQRTAIEAALVNADHILGTVDAKLTRAETKLTNETHAWIDARLNTAVKAQADARVKFQSESYSEAYAAVQSAVQIANEASAMIDSSLRLETKVDIKAGDLFEGVLNVGSTTGTKANGSTKTATSTEEKKKTNVDLNVDAGTDVEVDTDVIDTNIGADAAVDTVTNVGL